MASEAIYTWNLKILKGLLQKPGERGVLKQQCNDPEANPMQTEMKLALTLLKTL